MIEVFLSLILLCILTLYQYLFSVPKSCFLHKWNHILLLIFNLFLFWIFLPHIPINLVFYVEIFTSYLQAILFSWCAAICNSPSDFAIISWSSAYIVWISLLCASHVKSKAHPKVIKTIYMVITNEHIFKHLFLTN